MYDMHQQCFIQSQLQQFLIMPTTTDRISKWAIEWLNTHWACLFKFEFRKYRYMYINLHEIFQQSRLDGI